MFNFCFICSPDLARPFKSLRKHITSRDRSSQCSRKLFSMKIIKFSVVAKLIEWRIPNLHSFLYHFNSKSTFFLQKFFYSIFYQIKIKIEFWQILNRANLYPYHFQRVQALYQNDNVRRLQFCDWFINQRYNNHLNENFGWNIPNQKPNDEMPLYYYLYSFCHLVIQPLN